MTKKTFRDDFIERFSERMGKIDFEQGLVAAVEEAREKYKALPDVRAENAYLDWLKSLCDRMG